MGCVVNQEREEPVSTHESNWFDAVTKDGVTGCELSGTDPSSPQLAANAGISDLLAHGFELCAETVRSSGKRRFDIIVSLILLLLTAPVLLSAMLVIWLSTLGSEPVLYRQTRVGLNGRLITILKLRTMSADAERDGPRMALRKDPRITHLGCFLRQSRIDELPQLINVLRGEMSLIGPRPERPEFAAEYEREIEGYAWRYRVKPGITGLAQVQMGYAESLQDAAIKFYYDIEYIRNGSLRSDLVILLKTLFVVLTGQGAR
jgi:lipopolysaccharide/colanic/teichoic acid biosynthesis glycosyltransferase